MKTCYFDIKTNTNAVINWKIGLRLFFMTKAIFIMAVSQSTP